MNKSEKPKYGINTIGPKGINFRSRLEARWAELFTELGFEWDYEPIDLDGYIPDFIIKLPNDINNEILIEVKGITDFKKLIEHKKKIEDSGWKSYYLIVGAKLWNLDDIMKYKKIKKLNNLFHSTHNQKRIVIGILGLPNPKFIKDNKIYKYPITNNHYNFIKDIEKNKELYITKNFKYETLHRFYEKDDIEYLLKEIKSMDVNEKVTIELMNMEIKFEWKNEICFVVPNNIDKKTIEDNYIFTFNDDYVFEYNFNNLHLKDYDQAYKYRYKDITEYNENIINIWTNIQNKYQYKRKSKN